MADETRIDEEIDGFLFKDPREIAQARKEAEGVRYLRSKLDRNNPGYVLAVYNHAVDQKLFETPVGFSFLKELKDYLEGTNTIPKEEIHSIEVPAKKAERRRGGSKESVPDGKLTAELEKTKKRFHTALFFVFVLLASLIGMLVIAWLSRDNVTILNYENAIIDKYEDWEQELTERERVIREKEMALSETEGR